jgi:hypothetical protein
VNVVPVLARADTLTAEERAAAKDRVQKDIAAHGLHIYPASARGDYDAGELARNADILVRAKSPKRPRSRTLMHRHTHSPIHPLTHIHTHTRIHTHTISLTTENDSFCGGRERAQCRDQWQGRPRPPQPVGVCKQYVGAPHDAGVRSAYAYICRSLMPAPHTHTHSHTHTLTHTHTHCHGLSVAMQSRTASTATFWRFATLSSST